MSEKDHEIYWLKYPIKISFLYNQDLIKIKIKIKFWHKIIPKLIESKWIIVKVVFNFKPKKFSLTLRKKSFHGKRCTVKGLESKQLNTQTQKRGEFISRKLNREPKPIRKVSSHLELKRWKKASKKHFFGMIKQSIVNSNVEDVVSFFFFKMTE